MPAAAAARPADASAAGLRRGALVRAGAGDPGAEAGDVGRPAPLARVKEAALLPAVAAAAARGRGRVAGAGP